MGLVTVREALARSLNVPAVKIFDQLGRHRPGICPEVGLTTIVPMTGTWLQRWEA